jgi:hypothetical protein
MATDMATDMVSVKVDPGRKLSQERVCCSYVDVIEKTLLLTSPGIEQGNWDTVCCMVSASLFFEPLQPDF